VRAVQTVLFLVLLSGALLWRRPDPFDIHNSLYWPLRRAGLVDELWSSDLSHLRFESWPNRNGPIKSGFEFDPSEYGELVGYHVMRDRKDREESFRRHDLWLCKGKSDLTIEIQVFTTSNLDAHHSLLNRLLGTSFPIASFLRTGQRYALKLGDVCLIDQDPILYPPEDWIKFDFVRNNVRVQVYDSTNNDGAIAFSVARAIDEKIRLSR
jgi:hypothetical protein